MRTTSRKYFTSMAARVTSRYSPVKTTNSLRSLTLRKRSSMSGWRWSSSTTLSAGAGSEPRVRVSPRAFFQRPVISLGRPRIELARTADPHMRVGDHFLPMGNPAGGARDREHDGEHGTWNSQGAVNDPRIEI